MCQRQSLCDGVRRTSHGEQVELRRRAKTLKLGAFGFGSPRGLLANVAFRGELGFFEVTKNFLGALEDAARDAR
jgi:hypothetical protein